MILLISSALIPSIVVSQWSFYYLAVELLVISQVCYLPNGLFPVLNCDKNYTLSLDLYSDFKFTSQISDLNSQFLDPKNCRFQISYSDSDPNSNCRFRLKSRLVSASP